MKTNDWSTELIEKMHDANIVGDNAATAFCHAYQNGDTSDAWDEFVSTATQTERFDPNCYMLVIFPDGSCYADWKDGIDRFYPHISDLRAEDQDVDERMTRKEASDAARALRAIPSAKRAAASRENAKKGGRKPATDDERVYWAAYHRNGKLCESFLGSSSKRDAHSLARRIGGKAVRVIGGKNVKTRI